MARMGKQSGDPAMTDSTGLPITTVSFLVTREVRWFHEGPPPDAVLEWFDDDSILRESRADVYDLAQARRGIGLKYRGGTAYDIKHRTSVHEPIMLAGAVGRTEDWVKVSYPIGGEQGIEEPIVVEKQIVTKRFELVAESESGEGAGCEVELSSLRVAGDDYWSFGLETFGSPARRAAALAGALQRLLFETPLPDGAPVSGPMSSGYPEFLAGIGDGPGRSGLTEVPDERSGGDAAWGSGWA